MKKRNFFLGMLAILLASVLNLQAQTNQVKTECMQLQDARTDVAGTCNGGTAGWYNVIKYSLNGGPWTLLPADYDNNLANQPVGATANDCEYGAGITAVTVAISSGATSTNSSSLTGSVVFSSVGVTGGYTYQTSQDGTTWNGAVAVPGNPTGTQTNYSFTTAAVAYTLPASTGLSSGLRSNMFVRINTTSMTPNTSLDGVDNSGAITGCGGMAGITDGICVWKVPFKIITVSTGTRNGNFCNGADCSTAAKIAIADAMCQSGYRF